MPFLAEGEIEAQGSAMQDTWDRAEEAAAGAQVPSLLPRPVG